MRYQFNETIYKIIGDFAAQIKKHPAFHTADVLDIRGDLVLRMLEEIPKYDPARGRWEAFILKRLASKGSDLIRERLRQKAVFQDECFVSLETPLDSDQSLTLRQQLEESYSAPSPEANPDTELAEALAGLSNELREVLARLENKSQREVAREMKLSYNTFRYRYIQPLAKRLGSALSCRVQRNIGKNRK